MKRTLVVLVVLLSASLSGLRSAQGAADPPRRPNILFCFADDWGRYASVLAATEGRPSPNQIVKTPVIDRMAREGVLFKNAFVTAPSCTPCRSSLLSGQYFFRTGRGAILQGAIWDASIPSYPLLLRDAGYHIGETYKVWSPGTPNDAPYGAGKYAYEKAGGQYNNFSENATRMVREGMTFEAAKEKLLGEVRGNFEAFLADRQPGRPFCYWFGPTLTHRDYEKGSGRALWGIDPDLLQGKLPKFLPDVPEVRADFADYLGEVQAWDAGVGVLIQKLEAVGELDNTVVVISGDHGMPGVPGGKCNLYDFGVGVSLIARVPGVPGGRVVDDFVNLMDLAPTFLEIGGLKPPAVMTGRSFWNVLRSDKSGQVDPGRTWVVTGRERHVAAAREDNLPYPHRALRTPDFLYVRNFMPDRWPMGSPKAVTATFAPPLEELEHNTFVAFPDMDASPTKAWLIGQRNETRWQWHYDYAFGKRPAEELYDLRQDPDQTKNLAADPEHAAVKGELAARLVKILTDAGDPRVTGDGGTFDRPPYSSVPDPAPAKKAKRKKPVISKKPNVVFLLADQWRAKATGYEGDPNVKTPNLDQLARQSLNFRNVVSVCPVCTPYRAALMTGRFPTSTGMFLNDAYLPDAEVCFAEMFQQAGYGTAYIGKWHLDGHGRSSFVVPERRQGWDYWKAAECDHNYPHSHFYEGASDEKRFWDGYDAFAQTRDAQTYLRQHAQDDRPFVLMVSYGIPHFPHDTALQEYKDLYPPDKIQLPPNVPPELLERARREAQGYYAHCTALDKCLGDVLATLEETQLAERTILVFTSDHGEMLGSHGGPPYMKHLPWDEAARVPLLLRYPPAHGPQGRELKMPLTTPDILPTLLGLTGVSVPATIEGEDLSSVARGQEEPADRAALYMAVAPFAGRGFNKEYRAIRTSHYTYVRGLDGPWLLFDDQQDPHQLENLVERPEFATLRGDLDARLQAQLKKIGDDFRPAQYYVDAWGYEPAVHGSVSYAPGAKVQSPRRAAAP